MNLARALNDYADYWNDMLQDPHRALPLCQESFRLYTQMKDDEGITLSQMTMLDALIALGEYDASEKLLKDLRSLSERVGRPDMQPQIDWSEATMREGQGDYAIQQGKTKNGYRYYRVANSMAKRAKMLFSQFKFRSEVLEMDKILRRLERKSKSLNLEV
jgi:primosomal protein N'